MKKTVALTELKSLNLINKLLIEEINKIEALEVTYKMKSIQCSEKGDSDMCGIEEVSLNLPQELEQPRPTRQKKPATRSEDFLWN